MRFTLCELFQLDHAQGLIHPRRNFAGRRFLHAQAKGDIVENGHMWEKRVALKDGIDVAIFSRNVGDILVFQVDLPGIDALQPGNQAQDGRFAAARGAKQREKLAVIDGQIEIRNDRFTIEVLANPHQFHQR